MSPDLTTLDDIAGALGVTRDWLRGRIRDLNVQHVALSRGRMAFTAEQYDGLLAALSRASAAPTKRSQARQPRKGRAA